MPDHLRTHLHRAARSGSARVSRDDLLRRRGGPLATIANGLKPQGC